MTMKKNMAGLLFICLVILSFTAVEAKKSKMNSSASDVGTTTAGVYGAGTPEDIKKRLEEIQPDTEKEIYKDKIPDEDNQQYFIETTGINGAAGNSHAPNKEIIKTIQKNETEKDHTLYDSEE